MSTGSLGLVRPGVVCRIGILGAGQSEKTHNSSRPSADIMDMENLIADTVLVTARTGEFCLPPNVATLL